MNNASTVKVKKFMRIENAREYSNIIAELLTTKEIKFVYKYIDNIFINEQYRSHAVLCFFMNSICKNILIKDKIKIQIINHMKKYSFYTEEIGYEIPITTKKKKVLKNKIEKEFKITKYEDIDGLSDIDKFFEF